jgi:type IV pilus assembly protein PilV
MTMPSVNSHNPSRFQQGVTLLEVLIAIVVLSFGLLGMLGMLMNGLKMTSSSHYRTIAAQQLTAMADMINANPYLVNLYAPPASSTVTATCFTTGCSSAQLPPTDYGVWLRNLDGLLPPYVPNVNKAVVCLDSTPADGNSGNFACDGSGRPTVKICWNENARVAISSGGVTGADTSTDTCMSTQL